MEILYALAEYKNHLSKRDNKQTVMLGFSDGAKDGGYLMANWAIYSAKESLTEVSRKHGIEVCFFDGRGGPPARGGGSTYKFYAALGKNIESNQNNSVIQHEFYLENMEGKLMSLSHFRGKMLPMSRHLRRQSVLSQPRHRRRRAVDLASTH